MSVRFHALCHFLVSLVFAWGTWASAGNLCHQISVDLHVDLYGNFQSNSQGNLHGGVASSAKTRSRSTEHFKKKYLESIVTTPEENLAWVRTFGGASALSGLAGPEQKKAVQIEIEIVGLKKMNATVDFDYGTAFANFVLGTFRTGLSGKFGAHQVAEEGQQLPAGAQLEGGEGRFGAYSHWKVLRLAFEIPGDAKQANMRLAKNELFRLHEQWQQELLRQNVITEADSYKDWVQFGVAETSIGAQMVNRLNRLLEPGKKVLFFEDPRTQRELLKAFRTARNDFAKIKGILSGSRALESERDGLSFEAAVFMRHYLEASDGFERFKSNFDVPNLKKSEWTRIARFAKIIDMFTLSPTVVGRDKISLSQAKHGGFSVDIIAAGAENFYEVQFAVLESLNVSMALERISQAVDRVTDNIDRLLGNVSTVILGHFAKDGVILERSGDDLMGLYQQNLFRQGEDRKQRLEIENALVGAIAAQPYGSRIRISFVEPQVRRSTDRGLIASSGHEIISTLRKSLYGRISGESLSKIVFGIRYVDRRERPRENGFKRLSPEIIIKIPRGVELTETEQSLIQKEFERISKSVKPIEIPNQ